MVQKQISAKIDIDEGKKMINQKVDIVDFKNEIQKIKNMVHMVSDGGSSKSSINSGLKVPIK